MRRLALVLALALAGAAAATAEESGPAEQLRLTEGEIARLQLSGALDAPRKLARVMARRCLLLHRLERTEAAIQACADVEGRFGDLGDRELLLPVVSSKVVRGAALGQLKRYNEALALAEEIYRSHGGSGDGLVREQVGIALLNKAALFEATGFGAEAPPILAEAIRLNPGDAPPQRLLRAKARLHHGQLLTRLGRDAEALPVLADLATEDSGAPAPSIQDLAARAGFERADALRRLGRTQDSLAAYQSLAQSLAGRLAPGQQAIAARAFINRAQLLLDTGRGKEAAASLDEVQKRWGSTEEAGLRELVELAKTRRAGIKVEVKRARPDAKSPARPSVQAPE